MKSMTILILACSMVGWSFALGCGDDDDDDPTDAGMDAAADSDTDTDTDSDTDTDTDSDSDTGSDPSEMPACEGGKLDPELNLCWEDPPAAGNLNWGAANTYCNDLTAAGHDDWRIPLIQELISLIRGCGSSECPVHEPDCLGSSCDNGDECNQCEVDGGPGIDQCYWSAELSGPCEEFWSHSPSGDIPNFAWLVAFSTAGINLDSIDDADYSVRCVRDMP